MTDKSAATTKVNAAYLQKPFQISYRQIALPEPNPGEILLDVLACGICGYDLEIAEYLADKPQPAGHEVVGIIRQIGHGVTNLAIGDQVVLESSSFCGYCELCRNGQVDLCSAGANFWGKPALGFSEAMIVPACAAVPAPDIDPFAAVLAEPCGVALDMIKTAEIGITDRLLLVGAGPIGLMALTIARRLTSNILVVANRSRGRLKTALRLGADEVFSTEDYTLTEYSEKFGGFDKILLTAPPTLIPDCISAAAYGGYIIFIGSDYQGGGIVPLDTHALHFGKKQLRSSFASPALYLPQALHLLRQGIIPAAEIVTHRLPLNQLADGMKLLRDKSTTSGKIVIIPDILYQQQ